jgi:hypothetical protein
MAVKRKFDADLDDATESYQQTAKQLKLLPFPSSDSDCDAMMCDAPMDTDYTDYTAFHSRLSSSASTSSISTDSPDYPVFELYPSPSESPSRMSPPVGLMQPTKGQFTHHNLACVQIPKLRVACEAGPNGQRSMWALCEECGAIEMVDS